MQNNDAYHHAKRNAERKIGFFIHLVAYVCVNAALISLNFAQHIGVPWSLGPLIGWGIGLFVHGTIVFFRSSGIGCAWKQRMIEREMARHMERTK